MLITSEDWTKPSRVGRITVNQGSKQRYYKLAHGLTGAQLQAKYSNMIALNVLGNPSDVKFIDCDLGAPVGGDPSDFVHLRLYQAIDLHFIGNRLSDYRSMVLSAQTRVVYAHNVHDRFGIDATFFGAVNGEAWVDGTFDDNLIGRGIWISGDMNHPDAGQLATTLNVSYSGTMSISDTRSYLADGTTSWNAFHGALSGSTPPVLTGTYKQFGGFHAGLTTYAMAHIGNANYAASVATELWASTAVRALTGVTGSISAGKGSGAQGFDTWSDDGTTPVPANNQRYPGHNQTAAWPTGANLKINNSYFDGVAPALVGTMDISTSVYKGRGSNSTDTAGLTPAQINDNSGYFADPNRIVDWAGKTLLEIDAIHAEMYRAKVGGPLDNGDGTFKGRWLPSGKVNQLGRATLSAALDAGVVTVSLSVSLAVDVVCDVLSGGDVVGTITIPAGETSAAGAFGAGPFTIRNDSGLVNPAVA